MSHVTNVVLLMAGAEHPRLGRDLSTPALDHINEWLSHRNAGKLHLVDRHGANSKYMECAIAIGAFNYLDVKAFKAEVFKAPWWRPHQVQLLVREEEDLQFVMCSADQPTEA